MSFFPAFPDFAASFSPSAPALVWTRLTADLETPVSAMLKLMREGEPSFLLESVQGGETRGRYSLIGLDPDLIWRCHGGKAEMNLKGSLQDADFTPLPEPSLASLKKLVRESTLPFPDSLPPMSAGLIGYMGYDMVKLMEKLPDANPDPIGLPDAMFMRPRLMVIFDAALGELFLVTPLWKDHGFKNARAAYDAATARLEKVAERLQHPSPWRGEGARRAGGGEESFQESPPSGASPHLPPSRGKDDSTFTPSMTPEAFRAMVTKAKEYIKAGDIFQVVPSQRFSAPFALPPFALYRSLRHLNPSPFLFYLHFGNFSLVGSSPEILVRLRDRKVTIRPLAGTRRRGATPAEDKALEQELLADPKEIAEHLMLLDLGRNDVGRVARVGTVKVTERMVVERYSHVMHIVSNVEGEIDPKHDAIDALIAGFPAGTVSGAPKIRAMEIIDELEPLRRSFYAGCVGYFAGDGTMDNCITLRTGLVKDNMLYVQAGGGVVADSDPQAEYEESVNKAKALMRAAEEAERFV